MLKEYVLSIVDLEVTWEKPYMKILNNQLMILFAKILQSMRSYSASLCYAQGHRGELENLKLY